MYTRTTTAKVGSVFNEGQLEGNIRLKDHASRTAGSSKPEMYSLKLGGGSTSSILMMKVKFVLSFQIVFVKMWEKKWIDGSIEVKEVYNHEWNDMMGRNV
jgi:hypothetical protein